MGKSYEKVAGVPLQRAEIKGKMESARYPIGRRRNMNQLMSWGPVAVIIGGYLIGLYFQTRNIDSLRNEIIARFDGVDKRFDGVDKRFDDMRDLWRAELRRVEEVLDARLKSLEERYK
jgi:hypothetical protein